MASVALQMVVVELENGRRGVFFGRPLVADSDSEAQCQVEDVYFSNINQIPEGMDLAELSTLAMAQFEKQKGSTH